MFGLKIDYKQVLGLPHILGCPREKPYAVVPRDRQ